MKPCAVCSQPAAITVDGVDLCGPHGVIRSHTTAAILYRRAGLTVLADARAAEAIRLCGLMLHDPDEAARLAILALAEVAA